MLERELAAQNFNLTIKQFFHKRNLQEPHKECKEFSLMLVSTRQTFCAENLQKFSLQKIVAMAV